ncbi:MAG: DUF3048 domain-containing protein [Candidatus Doudnabacteria bacterium]|nr:DUF3048 domain-containing protein [Candidatus Doudnabacteria bacterium]
MTKRKHLAVVMVIVVGGILTGYWWQNRYPDFASSPKPADSSQPKPQERPIKEPFLAVVVENTPESRPQSGLSLADFVFEAVTEAGITRMLVFYQSGEASMIGPVRSARPYFVDWALGFGAVLAYSGGSKEALEKIADLGGGAQTVNEFYNEKYFWRDQSKKSPHNLFTSTNLLGELALKKGWDMAVAKEPGWEVNSQSLDSVSATATEITINFSYNLFGVKYKYNPESNSYDRSLANKPHVDSLTQKQISANNVVILYTTSNVIDQELLTLDLKTTGTGRAVIFRDGRVIQARWKKESPGAPLRLLDADGSMIQLHPGSSWFAVLDQHGSASWR